MSLPKGPYVYVPGEFNADPGSDQFGSIKSADGWWLAALERWTLNREDELAVAHLFAAAPEILLALQETAYVLHVIGRHQGEYENCEIARCVKNRAVVAKALGDAP